ncbi:hypothetical protein OEZ85_006919 [Tetradesmus obliquus]|uniref:RRM domain-containing protein n=1 Tax=Tetradesmus obliquus TaxID=3088 RepID=A0ABY8TYJ3_TETOB|nr:hypothetical protein OEZ85_006919 [Tetradesmus obliquus]
MTCSEGLNCSELDLAVEDAVGACLEASCGEDAKSVFFARCPPLITSEELQSLFESYGTVTSLNLFKRWATARTSKGCGVVTFSRHESAAAALAALHGKHMWPESEAPMVIEWLDPCRLAATQQRNSATGRHTKRPNRRHAKRQADCKSDT